MPAETATPLFVVKALAEVRESGLTNMLDRDAVEMLVTDQRAAEWLTKASNREFMTALNDMGRAVSDDWMGADQLDSDDNEDYDPMDYDGGDFSDDPSTFLME